MEPEEYDAINEEHHPQNSRREIIERLVWSSSDEVRNHFERFHNNIDYRLRQMTQNRCSGEMREYLSSHQFWFLITASYCRSSIRRYNFWTRRHPDENSDHTVPGIEVKTYLPALSSLDQVVPCGTNQSSVPIRVTGLTGMRENCHNLNVLSSQESYIDQTNVNLSVDCQERKPKSKRKKYNKVYQNHQDYISRRVNERAYRLNSCHKITKLENSSSTEQLTTQGFECQNACSSTSLVNVPKTGEPEILLPQNQEAKLPVPSASMQTCNKERSASSEKQYKPSSRPLNSEVPSASTRMSSSTAVYNTYPESDSNLQSPFPTFSSFNNRNVTIEHNYSKPQVLQFSNAQITSCSSNISLQENLCNDNSSACLKNTENKNSIIKERTTGVNLQSFYSSAHTDTRASNICENECSSSLNKPKSMEKNTYSSHGNTLSNPLQTFIRNSELISNKPMPLILRKMTEMEINNKESISKNSQKEGEHSLNPLLLDVANSDMHRSEPILMESCSTTDNNYEYVDTGENPKPNTEDSTTSISNMNLSKDSSPNSRLVETNQDTEVAETYRKAQIENSSPSNFASDSRYSAASNNKTSSLNAKIDKSEISKSFCDKNNKLTSTKLNSDKRKNSGDVQNLNGDSDEQVKENIPPDNSLPN